MEWYPNARQEEAVEKILPVSPDLPSGGHAFRELFYCY